VVATPVIPALGKLRRENCEFEDSIGYTVRPVSKKEFLSEIILKNL
jgi:hypothetical protein